MLVECGFVRVTLGDGSEYTFTPSFKKIASLGNPAEIVGLFVDLHGKRAVQAARYILNVLCDQEDPTPAVGWLSLEDGEWKSGAIPEDELLILAAHLMTHGIAGKAKPDAKADDGKYAAEFNAAEYVSAARVHLGLSSADAEGLSMTEFQMMLQMRFPESSEQTRNVPSREEYRKFMDSVKGRKNG